MYLHCAFYINLHPINTNKLSLMSMVHNDYGIISKCIIILVCIHVFGAPGSIISDQGIGGLLIVYANDYLSSLVHLQCNGLVERYNQTIQKSLIKLSQ